MWGPTEQEIREVYRSCKIVAVVIVCTTLVFGLTLGVLITKGCLKYQITRVEEPRP